ncbi:hypothetical protein [Undibacterium sp. TS12]|uniref:hypothetical protein n=1 Tax=Undibacterium sp. TS12 TaxID=2908202 RepID=UPI001F4CA9DD|nr:hypothetical protein [Undibacterium sp. TS12]MCH8622606.1 hypothetical protein [Undibacterium sp. TS12]
MRPLIFGLAVLLLVLLQLPAQTRPSSVLSVCAKGNARQSLLVCLYGQLRESRPGGLRSYFSMGHESP